MTIFSFALSDKPWCPFDQERKKLCAISNKMLKNIKENGIIEMDATHNEKNSVEKVRLTKAKKMELIFVQNLNTVGHVHPFASSKPKLKKFLKNI